MYKTMLTVAIVLAMAFGVAWAGQDKQKTAKAPADPDFAGKVLAIFTKDAKQGMLLQKARIQRLGSRAFVVGQYGPRMEDEEPHDELFWIPVDELLMIIEYKNLAAGRKALGAGNGRR